MTQPIDNLVTIIGSYARMMGGLNHQWVKSVEKDIRDFLEKTNQIQNQMYSEAFTAVVLTSFTASFMLASAMVSQGPSTRLTPTPNAGLFLRVQEWLIDKFNDNDFLRGVCNTAAKFCEGMGTVSKSLHQSQLAGFEAERTLVDKVQLSGSLSCKAEATREMDNASQAAFRVMSAAQYA